MGLHQISSIENYLGEVRTILLFVAMVHFPSDILLERLKSIKISFNDLVLSVRKGNKKS
jgi:hypothetical protein